MNETELLLKDFAIIVAASAVAMRIFSILKLPLLLGFIIVGILLSPVSGIIDSRENIAAVGELGVMFMMFFVGMEFNLERLKKVFAPSLFGIVFQIVAMGVLGMITARAMGMTKIDGIFLGGVLAMSSTIVIVEIFTQRRDLSKLYAQIAIGILILEDIFAVFLLVVLSGLSSGQLPSVAEVFRSTLALLSFMITIFILGKLFVPRMLKKFAVAGNRQELIMLTFCLIMVLGFLAAESKLSLSLGAFMAGSIISGSDVSRKIEHISDPFRNLFVALFFVSVGTQIDPKMILELWIPITIISVCVLVFQTLACFVGIILGGVRCKDAYLAAINKAQIGEFSFVIAGLGISSGVMNPSVMVIAMGVSFLTVFVNPFVSGQSERVMKFTKKISPRKVLDALEIYRRAVSSAENAASGNSSLKDLFAPLLKISVYVLFFSGIMFTSAHIADIITSESTPYPDWLAVGIWLAAAALSAPIVAGVIKESGSCAAKFADLAMGETSQSSETKLRHFLRGVFSAFLASGLFAIYFIFVFNFLPIGNALTILCGGIALMLLFFRKVLSNFRHSLEGRFSAVLKRHLENAEHNRREMLMASVRENVTWAKDVAEVEISEFSDAAGKAIGTLGIRQKTGAELAAIRRGAFSIYEITADTKLYPDDIAILCGSDEELTAAEALLTNVSTNQKQDESFGEDAPSLRVLEITEESALNGKNLKDMALPKNYSVKVIAILPKEQDTPSRPDPLTPMNAGDKLLCVGRVASLEKMIEKLKLAQEN